VNSSIGVGEADFALLGHQENWGQIAAIVRALRPSDTEPMSLDEIRSIVPWIPPRTVSRIRVRGFPEPAEAQGVYIDTFITPDELRSAAVHPLLGKVRAAAQVAEREGARIASLGGFTSILLEGSLEGMGDRVVFTTGNSLTAALIFKGIEAGALRLNLALSDATCLVIGGTGDVGSACARWLGPRVGRLILAARHPGRLAAAARAFRRQGIDAVEVTALEAALPAADVIISAASIAAPMIDLGTTRPHALICDAGYPKNLQANSGLPRHIFWGGIGLALGTFWSEDGMLERFYRFPVPSLGHGCMLEGLLLAVARRYEPFSIGRGNITPDRIEEIWRLAELHGFVLAPFFNHEGLWPGPHIPAANDVRPSAGAPR